MCVRPIPQHAEQIVMAAISEVLRSFNFCCPPPQELVKGTFEV
jgi:hypothetical protein